MGPCIDIHSHIMPGVDDGSPDMKTSLEMLKIAVSEGTENIILTPHHKPMHRNLTPEKMKAHRDNLQQAANDAGIKVRLFTGNEIYYSDETMDELEQGYICPLASSEYVLIEFHPTDSFANIRNAIYKVQFVGYIPVLAHVERYADIVEHSEYVDELIKMGCYIQENASSIMGKYGFGIKHFTRKLLKEGKVHFVATDAHDSQKRAPHLAECRKLVENKYGVGYANEIFFNNPLHILKHQKL
ncbi:MAG: hypothetical protein K6B41_07380 [Butyrivibrio sp.]|nr:hypothetical protein [Butyrivibrio sp.]